MLSHKYRFHSRGGVRYVYQKGKTIRTPNFSLVFTQNLRGKRRFAVVISKKVIKDAVGRNRARRRVYEALRAEIASYPKPMDYIIVIYNKAILKMPFIELRQAIKELLDRSLIEL